MKNKTYSSVTINLFKEWDNSKIKYCHWKSIDHLEASYLALTDLDVLIDKKDANSAIHLALKNGFVEVKSSHFRGYPGVRDFISYDSEVDNWVHLHFHTQLSAGDRWVKAYHFPFERFILKDRVWNKTYQTWTIAPIYELLILVFRMNAKFSKNWLKDKKILEEIKFIQLSHQTNTILLDEEITNYIRESGIKLLNNLITKEDPQRLNINEFRKAFKINEFRRMSRGRFFFLSKLRYSYRIYSEIRRRILKIYSSGRRTFPGGGYIIAFIGIDGSGKTSGIERIKHFFSKQINVQCNFLGSGKSGAGFIRKTIMNIVGFKASSKGHKEARDTGKLREINKANLKKPPLHYSVWIWLCTRDREKQIKRIQRGLGNGNLVFVDRWLQDNRLDSMDAPRFANFIDFNGFTGYVARREAELYRKVKLIPLHQVIKINIDSQTSVKRKPEELRLEEAHMAIDKLDKVEWQTHTKIVNIDGTEQLKQVTINLKKAVFKLLNQ